MQKVMVQIDWYTKIILTLIIVLLAGLLARPYIEPRIAKGAYDQKIEIGGSLEIDGRGTSGRPFYISISE